MELFHTLIQRMLEAGVLSTHADAALAMMPSAYGVLELLALLRGVDSELEVCDWGRMNLAHSVVPYHMPLCPVLC